MFEYAYDVRNDRPEQHMHSQTIIKLTKNMFYNLVSQICVCVRNTLARNGFKNILVCLVLFGVILIYC